MTRSCAGCGKAMDDSAAFCPACGRAVATPEAGADGPAAGLQSNLAGALCYLWITAIVFLLLEPYNRDRFVRFHAFQALFHGLAWIVGNVALTLLPFIGWSLLPLWSLLMFVLAIIAAVKAYQNEKWQIPVVGPFAEKQV